MSKAVYDETKQFVKPYFDLKIALALKNKIIPVLFSDNVSSIFSDEEEERDWAIKEWKDILLLADDAKADLKVDPLLPGRLVFDENGDSPQRFTLLDTPAAIQKPSRLASYVGGDYDGMCLLKAREFKWSRSEYRRASRVLRAVCHHPPWLTTMADVQIDAKPNYHQKSSGFVDLAQIMP